MCLLAPGVIKILYPQSNVAREFLGCPLEYEIRPPGGTVAKVLHSHSLHPFLLQALDILLVCNVTDIVRHIRAARVDLMFEIGSFLDDGRYFFLLGISR